MEELLWAEVKDLFIALCTEKAGNLNMVNQLYLISRVLHPSQKYDSVTYAVTRQGFMLCTSYFFLNDTTNKSSHIFAMYLLMQVSLC